MPIEDAQSIVILRTGTGPIVNSAVLEHRVNQHLTNGYTLAHIGTETETDASGQLQYRTVVALISRKPAFPTRPSIEEFFGWGTSF